MAQTDVSALLLDHKRGEHRWIGLEVERHIVSGPTATVRYFTHMKSLLSYLVTEKGWRVDYEVDGNVLGLSKNLHAISLEPGSQFEISLAPRQTIAQVQQAQREIDAEVNTAPIMKDLHFLEIGVNPWERADDIEILPSPRYRLMDQHFQKIEGRGREMMRLSAGVQMNLDFSTEAEGIEMFRSSMLAAPYLSTLFANSPYHHGRRTGFLSERHRIWNRTDPKRSGFLNFALSDSWTLQSYADHVSSIPLMYAYRESGEVFDPKGAALSDLSPELQKKNALAALRQLFSLVRFKPCCVEIRYFDEVSEPLRMAATALCVGLFYDEKNRQEILETTKSISYSQAQALMDEGSRLGLKSNHHFEVIKAWVKLAEEGLLRRGFAEENFLAPLEDHLLTRKTPADLLIEKHSEVWRT